MNTDSRPDRVLARRVIAEGVDYGLAIVEIAADHKSYKIEPFRCETAHTRYHSGIATIFYDDEIGWNLRLK